MRAIGQRATLNLRPQAEIATTWKRSCADRTVIGVSPFVRQCTGAPGPREPKKPEVLAMGGPPRRESARSGLDVLADRMFRLGS